jgi:uncharacterized integral membrane protein
LVQVFLELSLILVGIAAASLGFYLGGATEARTTWVAIGTPALVLAGLAIFAAVNADRFTSTVGPNPGAKGQLAAWAFAAASAAFLALAASATGWGLLIDRTLGYYGFLYAAAAGLSAAGVAVDAGKFNIHALGILIAAIAGGLVFFAGAAMPRQMVIRRVAGWLLVLSGLGIAFLGYAPSVNVSF